MHRLRRGMLVGDVLAVLWAVAGVHFTAYGLRDRVGSGQTIYADPTFLMTSLFVGLSWIVLLWAGETRHPVVLGAGSEEYRRVVAATFRLVALVALASYLTQNQVGRRYLLVAIPVGLLALLANRWAWRHRLIRGRDAGIGVQNAVLVGTPRQMADVERRLSRQANELWRVVARVEQPVAAGAGDPAGPAQVDADSILRTVDDSGAGTIIVAGGDHLEPGTLRELGWRLRGSGVGIAVVPSVVDVAGPRIHVRPVAGLALLHLEEPSFSRGGWVVKRTVDIVGSVVGLVLLAPVLLAIGLLIRLTSEGPALYRQERIGYDGTRFQIWKFRSMRQNADAELQQLLQEQGRTGTPLFKVDHDPRITGVGRFLRAYSIDELPQLINVLVGDMSLVGPRPQRDLEVALYTPTHRRRLLARPGMTGLWQVSGRNEIAWEHAAELDLYYVENWSLGLDVVLMMRTISVVLRGSRSGAR